MIKKFIIGIDEVGRGSLAGPVVVAALALPEKFKIKKSDLKKFKLTKLRDSKKLSLSQREAWFNYIKKQMLSHGIASVSPKIIDKINISQAANLAATKAFKKLIKNYKFLPAGRHGKIKNCLIFLDGGLYLNIENQSAGWRTKTIIKGDEKIPAISLASIVAKVYRDKLMKKLHKKYSQYDFINNVGYGTKKHIKAIKKIGYSSIHRKSFKIK
ncbi:ribonuclease HII [Candidatus Wolfebacteria bacterium]|nr:ribonuclease HII [Candidatus Wolfebacteria bacterium]